MAGRRRVDHDRVPAGTTGLLTRRLVPDLPDRHQLLQSGRGGHEVLVELAREHGGEEPFHRDNEAQVLLERRPPIEPEHVQAGRHLGRHVADAAAAEERREAPDSVHLDRERAPTPAHEEKGERRSDRRLADPSLADDEV